jgi:GT2 family glycosyltransferase
VTSDHPRGAGGDFEDAKAFRLGSEVAILIWDLPRKGKCTLSAPRQPLPLVNMTLPLRDGRQRALWAMKPGRDPEHVRISASDDGDDLSRGITLQPVEKLPLVDVETLFAGLSPEGSTKFLNNLLTVWRSAFRLSRDELFTGVVEDAVHALVPVPRPARCVCPIVEGRYLAETAIKPDLGDVTAIYAIGMNAVLPMPAQCVIGGAEQEWRPCHFILEARRPPEPLLIVFLGRKGIAVRDLPDCTPRSPDLQKWWNDHRGAPALRDFVVRQLAGMPEGGVARAIDLQIQAPLPARHIAKSAMSPAAEVDLALAQEGGLLAGGWTHDPASTLAGIDYLTEDGTAVPLDGNWYEFSGWARGAEDGSRTDVTGFVAWLPLAEPPGPLLQPRFQMRLASGGVKPLVPKPQPFEPAAQRNRILRAVPPQHAVDEVFRTILAPALQDVEHRLGKTVKVSRTKDYGLPQKAPLVSIVVPLYRVLDFLRFQLSGLATDPWLAENAEIIYVLDSPEILDDTEHLLGGLHLLHGLPMKLVVMNRNGGYARACNAGARFARGAILVMLNSDVVPSMHGWLQPLARPLLEQGKLGAIGPKLIFEDGSLQHAGLYFARDRRGVWLNHHFHKGMPGHYAPAQAARSVPAVTGACLVTRRDIFEQVGSYTEDYVIGDYEDSDLCLKIRRMGLEIAYEPASCLYHFERRSIRRSQDYMRGVASHYNAWLHTQRWNDEIEDLMAAYSGQEPGADVLSFDDGDAQRSAA